MEEVWKGVVGYEDRYQVSNFGNVRSIFYDRNTRYGIYINRRIKAISQNIRNNGYKYVSLNRCGKSKKYNVHRLVAEAFISKIPGKNCVNHIDYDRTNNNVTNLEWCTHHENTQHSLSHFFVDHSVESNTGEKYIHYDNRHKNYQLTIKCKYIGRYKTLPEAVDTRNCLLCTNTGGV